MIHRLSNQKDETNIHVFNYLSCYPNLPNLRNLCNLCNLRNLSNLRYLCYLCNLRTHQCSCK